MTSKMNMLIMILITDQTDGEVLVELSITSLHLLVEAAEINSQSLHWEASNNNRNKTTVLHQNLTFAVLIVKQKEISLEKLTKF